MSLRDFLVTVLLAFLSVTKSEGAGTMMISITPPIVKEFTSYTIRCQYPSPGVNLSTTGVLQVTHLSPPNDVIIYKYDFDNSVETVPSAIQNRATASLNKTATLAVIDVQVSYADDSGRYSCSLVDANTNTSLSAQPMSLNVTGCVGGSQLASIVGCPSVSVGLSCSIFCNSTIANATVSLSRNINGSPQLVSELNEINYTIGSVQSSDFGTYYCYVRTEKCNSMASTSVTAAPATTAPPGCGAGGCGGGRRLPGWGIALIVIACILLVAIIAAIVIFFLYKKGIFNREKENGVQPTSGGQGRTVANDNYAMSRAKSAGGKKDTNTSAAAVVTFPEVKQRKSQLPPLEPQGWNRRQQTEENSSPDVAKRRPLPKRTTDNGDENASPDVDRRRRSSQGRRQSDDEGDSPERGGGRLPPIRISSHREEDEDDHGRF